MQASPIQAAYLPFAELLQSGGFTDPDTGWTAGQVGAHVSLSNEIFSDLAERMHKGEDVSFDNSPVQDDAGLLAYAAEQGDLAGLAEAIRTSAGRLAQAYGNLTEEERARPIPVTMWHEGQIARDQPNAAGRADPRQRRLPPRHAPGATASAAAQLTPRLGTAAGPAQPASRPETMITEPSQGL